MQVWSLGQEDPLEKEMATHYSILVWKTPWAEKPGGLHSPWGCKESNTNEQLRQDSKFPLCRWRCGWPKIRFTQVSNQEL